MSAFDRIKDALIFAPDGQARLRIRASIAEETLETARGRFSSERVVSLRHEIVW